MNLIDILARELNEWPEDFNSNPTAAIVQDGDRTLCSFDKTDGAKPDKNQLLSSGDWSRHFWTGFGIVPNVLADDFEIAIVTRAQWQEARDELNKPVVEAWNGEGLPPIGTEFEFTTNAGYNWHRGSMLFMDHQVVLLNGYQLFEVKDPDLAFRPIITPEHIAGHEMIAGLNEMIGSMKDHPSGTHGVSHFQELMIHEDVARDLWAAGYRKQEPKPR